ncbi:unnamed protein product, partial [Closterium sp. NIES-65]
RAALVVTSRSRGGERGGQAARRESGPRVRQGRPNDALPAAHARRQVLQRGLLRSERGRDVQHRCPLQVRDQAVAVPPDRCRLALSAARSDSELGSLGKNLQCSQVAPSVWDCFGQTKLTQADINNIGFTAGVGVRVNSYALSLTYMDAHNMGLVVDSNANLAVAKANSKMEQVFGKTDLLAGVAAGRFQAGINSEKLKGGAMFAVSN